MFKNLVILKIQPGWTITAQQASEAVEAHRFTPTEPTQEMSIGWVEPRGEDHAELVESVDGELILKLMMETRSVATGAVLKKAKEAAAKIEAETGRIPGKKEMKALREEALLSLLPTAHPVQASFLIWIDRASGFVAIDANTQGKVDEVVTTVVRTFGGMAVSQLSTNIEPSIAMKQWLLGLASEETPENFSIDRDCELKSTGKEGGGVKYQRHNLDCEEVRNHIVQGLKPTKLAITWNDRLSFVLTDSLALRKLKFLDVVFDNKDADAERGFDADVALVTGELKQLIPDLIKVLGGSQQLDRSPASDVTGEASNSDSAAGVDQVTMSRQAAHEEATA